MIIPRRQISGILDALLNMDGPKDKPSKFTPKTRYSLSKNVRLLNTVFEDMDKAKNGYIRELAPETFRLEPGTPESIKFTGLWEAYLDAEGEDIPGLMRFTLAELNLDVNELPIVVLAKLGPLIIED